MNKNQSDIGLLNTTVEAERERSIELQGSTQPGILHPAKPATESDGMIIKTASFMQCLKKFTSHGTFFQDRPRNRVLPK